MEKKVDIKLLKKLRNKSLVSFSLCKEALFVNNNNFDKAFEWLRMKGIADKAEGKKDQKNNEGICATFIQENFAVLLKLSCKTDFVARNEIFRKFFFKLGELVAKHQLIDKPKIEKLSFDSQTVKEKILELTTQMGEKIDLEKITTLTKNNNHYFGFYNHNDYKSCSLVVLDQKIDFELREDLAMHIVAMKPSFIDLESIDTDFYNQEKNIIINQVKKKIDKDKSLDLQEKIIQGKLNKHLKSLCILEQKFVKSPSETTRKYLYNKNKDVKIIGMSLLTVGN